MGYHADNVNREVNLAVNRAMHNMAVYRKAGRIPHPPSCDGLWEANGYIWDERRGTHVLPPPKRGPPCNPKGTTCHCEDIGDPCFGGS